MAQNRVPRRQLVQTCCVSCGFAKTRTSSPVTCLQCPPATAVAGSVPAPFAAEEATAGAVGGAGVAEVADAAVTGSATSLEVPPPSVVVRGAGADDPVAEGSRVAWTVMTGADAAAGAD